DADVELLHPALEDLGFRGLRKEMPLELVNTAAEHVGAGALVDDQPARRLGFGASGAKPRIELLGFDLVGLDLAMQRLDLGAQRNQLDALTVSGLRLVGEPARELTHLLFGAGERLLGRRERGGALGEFHTGIRKLVDELLLPHLERVYRLDLLVELEPQPA